MKSKIVTLESFKSLVKRIIKEEMNQDDKKFHRENVMNLDGDPIRLIVTNLKTNETKIIEGTINHINDYDGNYSSFSPGGFWLNPDKKGMFVMFDEDNQKWVDGNSHSNIKIEGASPKDTFLLNKIKETIPEYNARWNSCNLIKRYSNRPQLEESKKRK
jgi:hypothetical protein